MCTRKDDRNHEKQESTMRDSVTRTGPKIGKTVYCIHYGCHDTEVSNFDTTT